MTRLLIVIILLSTAFNAVAEGIYRWTDAHGRVHYSSSPPAKDSKPVILPKIAKGEVKLPKTPLLSCAGHGGVDCNAGPDKDGSVVCYDGFQGAAGRFRLTCSSPKLEAVQLSPEPNGAFIVTVRNKKPVHARDVIVSLKQRAEKPVKLHGPQEIDSLGTGEYVFTPKPGATPRLEKPSIGAIDLKCSNC